MRSHRSVVRGSVVSICALAVCASVAAAQGPLGSQQRTQKISDLEGGFGGTLASFDFFGASVATIGDVDGDGLADAAVGSRDRAALGRDSVWVLFLNADGTVREEREITIGPGRTDVMEDFDFLAPAVAALGDLDGNGVPDLAIGERDSDDGGYQRGAVHLVLLQADGSVLDSIAISSTQGGLSGPLQNGDRFGAALAVLEPSAKGALLDLAVGASGDDTGGFQRGAVWVLSLGSGGAIVQERKIAQGLGGFAGNLANRDHFGASLAALGDLDGDERGELAVGAPDDGAGAVWILYRDASGLVTGQQKIADGDFPGALDAFDAFGTAVATLGDLNADGTEDLAVGAPGDDDGGQNRGAVWLLFLDADGGVQDSLKLSDADPGFAGRLSDRDAFGRSLAFVDDLDANGLPEILAGAPGDDDGGLARGAVYAVFFQFPDAIVSNGNGINALALQGGTEPPQLGHVWDPILDESLLPEAGGISFNIIGASSFPLSQSITVDNPNVMGELLIDLAQLQLTQSVPPGERFALPIPNNVQLVGLDCFTQGVAVRGSRIFLTNRLDVVIGFPPSAP